MPIESKKERERQRDRDTLVNGEARHDDDMTAIGVQVSLYSAEPGPQWTRISTGRNARTNVPYLPTLL